MPTRVAAKNQNQATSSLLLPARNISLVAITVVAEIAVATEVASVVAVIAEIEVEIAAATVEVIVAVAATEATVAAATVVAIEVVARAAVAATANHHQGLIITNGQWLWVPWFAGTPANHALYCDSHG
jgi:hypothetical protein